MLIILCHFPASFYTHTPHMSQWKKTIARYGREKLSERKYIRPIFNPEKCFFYCIFEHSFFIALILLQKDRLYVYWISFFCLYHSISNVPGCFQQSSFYFLLFIICFLIAHYSFHFFTEIFIFTNKEMEALYLFCILLHILISFILL